MTPTTSMAFTNATSSSSSMHKPMSPAVRKGAPPSMSTPTTQRSTRQLPAASRSTVTKGATQRGESPPLPGHSQLIQKPKTARPSASDARKPGYSRQTSSSSIRSAQVKGEELELFSSSVQVWPGSPPRTLLGTKKQRSSLRTLPESAAESATAVEDPTGNIKARVFFGTLAVLALLLLLAVWHPMADEPPPADTATPPRRRRIPAAVTMLGAVCAPVLYKVALPVITSASSPVIVSAAAASSFLAPALRLGGAAAAAAKAQHVVRFLGLSASSAAASGVGGAATRAALIRSGVSFWGGAVGATVSQRVGASLGVRSFN